MGFPLALLGWKCSQVSNYQFHDLSLLTKYIGHFLETVICGKEHWLCSPIFISHSLLSLFWISDFYFHLEIGDTVVTTQGAVVWL